VTDLDELERLAATYRHASECLRSNCIECETAPGRGWTADVLAELVAKVRELEGLLSQRVDMSYATGKRYAELEAELDDVCAQAATFRAERDLFRAELRGVARYADGLHFAGRLADEKVVRAALSSSNDVPVHPELEDGGLDLLGGVGHGAALMAQVGSADLYTLLVGSVRYALGRSSYITATTADIVRRHWRDLDAGQREVVLRDLREAIDDADRRCAPVGMRCDHEGWVALVRREGPAPHQRPAHRRGGDRARPRARLPARAQARGHATARRRPRSAGPRHLARARRVPRLRGGRVVTWPFDQLLEVWRVARADRSFPDPTPPVDAGNATQVAAAVAALRRDDLARKALEIAVGELGRGEDGGNNKGADIARYCGREGVNWCAGGCGYCYDIAARDLGVELPFQRSLGAKALGKAVAAVGRRVTDPHDAEPGDLLVLDRGAKGSWLGHVELVERVAGNAVHTIAFNSGPKVRRRVHPLPIPRLAFLASVRR
jgi:hypothetical protein